MRHILILAVCGLFLAPVAQAEPVFVNAIQVIVNDAVITYKDVAAYLAPIRDVLARQYGADPRTYEQKMMEAQREAVDQLVERQLMLYDFKVSGYNFPESIIDEEIKRNIREQFGDRLTLTRTLSAENMTYESYRQQTRERIIVEALRAKNISSEIVISPYKIETFYRQNTNQFIMADQVKLRMIVLNKTSATQAESQKKLAQEILKKVDGGASFAEMASIYSEGSQRADGGNWGWVEKTVLRKELADVAFTLKAGGRSGVIETPEAVYLMLVEETRTAHVRPLTEVRDQIEKNLLVLERARLQKKYVDRLKKKSFIRYF